MAGFMSVMAVPGAATEAEMARRGLGVQRYCQTKNCRNGIRLTADDKLCEQCLGSNGSVSSSITDSAGNGVPQQPPRTSLDDPQGSLQHEAREDRDEKPVPRSLGPVKGIAQQSDPYSAHLAMLDERQQNRARKLEQETEEVDGRWRTIQSATDFLGASPPPTSRPRSYSRSPSPFPSRYRKPGTDRAVTVDAYRPNGLYRPGEIDGYRSEKSPSYAHRSDDIERLYKLNPLRSPEPAKQPVNEGGLRPSNKRKSEDETAGVSNKSSKKTGPGVRCGKRKCRNMCMQGKDRCRGCYHKEGRHSGDERRRCASSGCNHCISDTITGDLCRTCLGVELGDIKLRVCSRPLCNNTLQPGIAGSLCLGCYRLAFPVRHCQEHGCNTVLPSSDRSNYCKAHAPVVIRVCSRPGCNNDIAANITGKLCRICLAKTNSERNLAKQQNSASPYGHMQPPSGPAGYQTYSPYTMPYNYGPLQPLQVPSYQQSFQTSPLYEQPQPPMCPVSFPGQSQRMNNPQPLQGQSRQLQYHAPQPTMGHPQVLQQQATQHHDYRGRLIGQPQQVEGRHSSFLTQQFRQPSRLVSRSQPSSLLRDHTPSHPARSQLVFDENPLPSGFYHSTQPLRDTSSSARRLRVTTMQRMLKAPCFGCLSERGAHEASTHPQIYCVHLPSTVRQAVLLDHEQWKEMCLSGQEAEEGEIDSDIDIQGASGHDIATSIKREDEEGEQFAQASPPTHLQNSQRHLPSSVTASTELQEFGEQPRSTVPSTELQRQDGRTPDFVATEPQHQPPVTHPVKTVSDALDDVAKPIDNTPVSVGALPDNWAIDSIRELLELKAAAKPGTPLEVAIALQQELRNCLLRDVTEGDPQDGEPSAIGLLRVLDQQVESLLARPADG